MLECAACPWLCCLPVCGCMMMHNRRDVIDGIHTVVLALHHTKAPPPNSLNHPALLKRFVSASQMSVARCSKRLSSPRAPMFLLLHAYLPTQVRAGQFNACTLHIKRGLLIVHGHSSLKTHWSATHTRPISAFLPASPPQQTLTTTSWAVVFPHMHTRSRAVPAQASHREAPATTPTHHP